MTGGAIAGQIRPTRKAGVDAGERVGGAARPGAGAGVLRRRRP